LVAEIGNNLHLLSSEKIIETTYHKLNSEALSEDEITIILCVIINLFHKDYPSMMDHILFHLEEVDEEINNIYWNVYVGFKGHFYPNIDWKPSVEATEYMIDYMAPSNISYLAGQLIYSEIYLEIYL
jgi:hypothetical protein